VLFSSIDTNRIGLIGHSLGGATSAQIGRVRDDIDAVIVLDGTMLGEEVAFDNNKVVLNNTPYPVPLLNVYAEDHYTNSKELVGEAYDNFHATSNALCATETVFLNAGHLNFTDLPLFSPALANMLGVGTIDARYCIETTNKIVLGFFDCHLKDAAEQRIEKEY
jgi:predicted dienelactone hydrolase